MPQQQPQPLLAELAALSASGCGPLPLHSYSSVSGFAVLTIFSSCLAQLLITNMLTYGQPMFTMSQLDNLHILQADCKVGGCQKCFSKPEWYCQGLCTGFWWQVGYLAILGRVWWKLDAAAEQQDVQRGLVAQAWQEQHPALHSQPAALPALSSSCSAQPVSNTNMSMMKLNWLMTIKSIDCHAQGLITKTKQG